MSTRWNNQTMRELEKESIRAFVEKQGGYFVGARVLDYGAGRQPYREIVERFRGDYTPYDRMRFPGSVVDTDVGPGGPLDQAWDVILCNQVIQYWPDPPLLLERMHDSLTHPRGKLIITGPTNWPEVENDDLHRYTMAGIHDLLDHAGFAHINVYPRAAMNIGDFWLSLGWGAVAWR